MKKQTQIIKEAKLTFDINLGEEAAEYCGKVIDGTHFNQISIPVYAKRKLVNKNTNESDDRIMTIGYIKKFDKDRRTFVVVVNNADCVNDIEPFNGLRMVPIIKTTNGRFTTILKFILFNSDEELNTIKLTVDVKKEFSKKDA